MSRPILQCPICGRPMKKGKRVAITLSWEYDTKDVTNRVQRNKIICRHCATGILEQMNMEAPNGI